MHARAIALRHLPDKPLHHSSHAKRQMGLLRRSINRMLRPKNMARISHQVAHLDIAQGSHKPNAVTKRVIKVRYGGAACLDESGENIGGASLHRGTQQNRVVT